MFSETTDPSLKSFIEVHADNHFPIQNLPYGVFTLSSLSQPHIGVAIGEYILDLFVLCQESSFFDEFEKKEVFLKQTLNDFMSLGKESWSKARKIISSLLQEDNPHLRDNKELKNKCLVAQKDATMVLPVSIGDYTDFYSSIYHATNVGIMFRGRENALQPNWRHLPVGYHGRASSIVLDQPVRRPNVYIKQSNF